MKSTHMRRVGACAVVAVGLIALAGCGGDSTKSQSLPVTEKTLGPNKYAYEGLKELHPGTVEIKFTNAGKVPHEFQLIRADGKHSADEVKAAITKLVESPGPSPFPDWFHANGGVGAIPPGTTATAKVVLKKSGTYYAIDGETPDSPDNAPPYLTQGAFASFEAKGDKIGGALPSQSTKVTVKDVGKDKFRFDNSSLKAGTVNLEFDNTSKEDHHVIAVPLLPGKTAAVAMGFLSTQGPPSGAPPIEFQLASGTAVLDPKQKEISQIRLTKPGNYVLLCFIGDRDGKGKPHFQEGLLKEVKVS
jgi:plastocyanin